MKTIYKYPLEITEKQFIEMPRHARVLSVAEQNGELYIWAMVETANPLTPRGFMIFGTGNPIREHYNTFVGTVLTSYGLVWHVFTNDEPQP